MVNHAPAHLFLTENVGCNKHTLSEPFITDHMGRCRVHKCAGTDTTHRRRAGQDSAPAFHHGSSVHQRLPAGMDTGQVLFRGPDSLHGLHVTAGKGFVERIVGFKNGFLIIHGADHQ